MVTDKQIDDLKGAIRAALVAYAEEHNETWYIEAGYTNKHWYCETATANRGYARFAWKKNRAPRSDMKVAAVLDKETGKFIRARVSKAGIRPGKTQPKNPPTIDSYTLNKAGVVEGVGYPERLRIAFVSYTPTPNHRNRQMSGTRPRRCVPTRVS